jgi:hypothetical protein
VSDHPSALPSRAVDYVAYSEPSAHFGALADLLEIQGIDISKAALLAMSYKDDDLLKHFAASTRRDWDFVGLTADWEAPSAIERRVDRFESGLADIGQRQRIIIARRVLEHVASHDLLARLMALLDERTFMLLDMLDYERLSCVTIDFLWNERRNYPTRRALDALVQRYELDIAFSSDGGLCAEPQLIALIGRGLKVVGDAPPPTNLGMGTSLQMTRSRWIQNLGRKFGKMSVIGASHKGVSAVQCFLPSESEVSLFDDRESLVGRWPPITTLKPIQRTKDIPLDTNTVVVSTSPANHGRILAEARERGLTADFFDSVGNSIA